MSLTKIGRARLCMVLPQHRKLLRSVQNEPLNELFESYALAAVTLDNLLLEYPRREELLREYEEICLELRAEVRSILRQIELQRE